MTNCFQIVLFVFEKWEILASLKCLNWGGINAKSSALVAVIARVSLCKPIKAWQTKWQSSHQVVLVTANQRLNWLCLRPFPLPHFQPNVTWKGPSDMLQVKLFIFAPVQGVQGKCQKKTEQQQWVWGSVKESWRRGEGWLSRMETRKMLLTGQNLGACCFR